MSRSQLHAEGFQSFTASDRLADRPFFVAPIFCQDWNTEDHRGYRHSSLIQKQKQHQVYRSLFFLDLAEPTSFPSCNCELTRHVAYLQHASVRFSPKPNARLTISSVIWTGQCCGAVLVFPDIFQLVFQVPHFILRCFGSQIHMLRRPIQDNLLIASSNVS